MTRYLLSMLMVLATLSTSAFAHQQKAAITTVLFNPRTQNIEVMHRFFLHDAEHAVKHIFDDKADILKDEKTQLKFADYVAERFTLASEAGTALTLKTVGYELEGKFFWVYQETPKPEAVSALTVSHEAMRDIWPTQVNTVNFEGNGDIRTLTFDDNVERLKVEFNRKH